MFYLINYSLQLVRLFIDKPIYYFIFVAAMIICFSCVLLYILYMSQQQQQQLQALLLPKSNIQKPITFLSLFESADKFDRILMILGSLAAIGAGIAAPFYMIFFSTISEIFVTGNQDQAPQQGKKLFAVLFLIGILTWIFNALAMWSWNKSGLRQATRLKKIYFISLLKQQISWYDSTDKNKITTQISQNILAIETAIGQKISFTISALSTSIFGIVFSVIKCWQMSLYLTLFLPFLLISGYLFMKSLSMKAHTGKMSYQNAANIAQTAFGSIKTIKILVSQKFQFKKFSNALQDSQPKLVKHILYSSISSGFMNLILMGIYSFGFFIGKQMMVDNPSRFTPSQIISTFFCFLVGGQSIGQITPIFKNIADAQVAYSKIHKIINRQQKLKENQTGIQLKNIYNVQICNVSFNYQNLKLEKDSKQNGMKKNILQNFSLSLKKGTVTAIVGSSGCGKSTVCQLLLNYYGINKGKIQINQSNINDLNTYQLRKKIGYVGQQPILFSMSIKQNIKLTNPKITDKQIIEVLKKSYAWDFVQKLQHGINSYVGSNGTLLSGGQKQRIAIARALAKNPQLIIFDEATSALDQQSERYVQKTIFKLAQDGAIVLLIAHRLSSIQSSDNIIVLDDGKIVQCGKHQQLLNLNNIYYKFVKDQLRNQYKNQVQEQQQNKINKSTKLLQNQQQHMLLEQKQKKKESLVNKQNDEKIQNRLTIYKRLLKYGVNFRKLLIFGSLFALINGSVYPFFNITFSNLMGLMANPEQNNKLINLYCIAFLIIAIIGAISNFSHTFLYGYFGQKLVLNLRMAVFNKILRFPCTYFDKKQNTPGALSIKLSQDSYQLHNALTGFMSVIFLNISTITISLAFALIFSWKLTLILLVFSPLMAAKGSIASNIMKRISKKSDQIQKNLGSLMSDTIGNIKTVKSFGGYDQFMSILNENVEKIQNITSSKFLKMGILQGFAKSSSILLYSIIFWIAAAMFSNHQFQKPIDALIAIFCIVFSATTVGQNSQLMPDLAKAERAANNILNILETKNQFQLSKKFEIKTLKKHTILGKIDFINVNFKYPSRKEQIIKNLNLHIKYGQKVALVGSSGSGKSTIIHILARLYPITSGKILIDGHQIEKYNLRQLRKKLGILSQQPIIFKGNINQNILYQFHSNQKFKKRFAKYSKISCVDEIAQQFAGKFEQQVGEKGCLVSGGQKQRIAIARCLIKQPKILVMDQPTSALDLLNQQKIFKNINKYLNNKTFLFTAHRLSTIKCANKIVVIKEGQIIEQGTYQELIEKKQQFYNMLYGNTISRINNL